MCEVWDYAVFISVVSTAANTSLAPNSCGILYSISFASSIFLPHFSAPCRALIFTMFFFCFFVLAQAMPRAQQPLIVGIFACFVCPIRTVIAHKGVAAYRAFENILIYFSVLHNHIVTCLCCRNRRYRVLFPRISGLSKCSECLSA